MKPRNHVALAMRKRGGAGAHRKSRKAERRAAQVRLAREL